jgi:hypothetical protein
MANYETTIQEEIWGLTGDLYFNRKEDWETEDDIMDQERENWLFER